MLTVKSLLVKPSPGRVLLFIGLLWLGGCGFQLNRNQFSLPEGAKSLSLISVNNQTFVSGLDLDLKAELSGLFNRAGVTLSEGRGSDLEMELVLTQSSNNREDLSIYNNLTYRYVFLHQGQITLVDWRNNRPLFEKTPVEGRFELETGATQLSAEELREGRRKAMVKLAQQIADKLTQNF